MKKIFCPIFILLFLISCKQEKNCCVDLSPVKITLKFTHNWDGVPVTSSDFNTFKFTNKNGEQISINRLRYVVSKIYLGDIEYRNSNNYQHNLIDVGENSGQEIYFLEAQKGTHNLKFTFGFSDTDNQDAIYTDLNSANFNVPGMLGGGYHFMQFDGKYKDSKNQDASFNYHAIRAVDRTDPNNLIFEDTSFSVDLGNIEIKNDATIEIKMNIAEWFKNPTTWNLSNLNTVLMPNFEAQKLISKNGETVFSLGDINQ